MIDNIVYTLIPLRIRNKRVSLDYSTYQIALFLKIEENTYLEIEKGLIEIELEHLIILSKIFNEKIDYFIRRELVFLN